MNLLTQIQVLSYSFLFGLYFSFTFNLLYKVLFTKYLILNIITNLIYFLGNSFLYFYLLYKLNNGIIHIYLLFTFLISFFLYNRLFVKIRLKWL